MISNIKLLQTNIRGHNNLIDVLHILEKNNFDVILLQETNLCENDLNYEQYVKKFGLLNYYIVVSPNKTQKSSCVMTIINIKTITKFQILHNSERFQLLLLNNEISIVNVYSFPSKYYSKNTTHIQQIREVITNNKLNGKSLFVGGDFNVNPFVEGGQSTILLKQFVQQLELKDSGDILGVDIKFTFIPTNNNYQPSKLDFIFVNDNAVKYLSTLRLL